MWKTLTGRPIGDVVDFVSEHAREGQVVHLGTDSLQRARHTRFVTVVAILTPGRGVRRRMSSVLPRPRPCGRETGAGAVASAPEDRYGIRLTAVKRRIRTCNPPFGCSAIELALAFQASCADILPSSEPVRGMRLVQGTSAPPAREPSASLRAAAATRRGRDDPRRGSRPSSRA